MKEKEGKCVTMPVCVTVCDYACVCVTMAVCITMSDYACVHDLSDCLCV